MTFVGFDLHKRYMTACALDAAGAIIAEIRQLSPAMGAVRAWLDALPEPVTVGLEAAHSPIYLGPRRAWRIGYNRGHEAARSFATSRSGCGRVAAEATSSRCFGQQALNDYGDYSIRAVMLLDPVVQDRAVHVVDLPPIIAP